MANVRALNKDKYKISKHKFLEAYHFCMQYNEWRDELKYNTDTVGSFDYSRVRVQSSGGGDATADLGGRRAELSRKCELVEQTAIEADSDIYEYILKAVTNEGVTYHYLNTVCGMPCGRTLYYKLRRKFYFLLSSKL